MIIIHVMNTLPRLVERVLADRLRVMPAVVVTGPRQAGKRTLISARVAGRRRYATLDELEILDAARREPSLLLDGKQPITLDEVQRAPELMAAVKRAIDRDRRAGRFLLTGSANLLLMQKVSETLAGRASYLTLWPMTRGEQAGEGRAGRWSALIDAPDADWIDVLDSWESEPTDWQTLAQHGGFPTPALELRTTNDRAIWFDGYVRTYLERDLQDLAAIGSLPDFRRLMRAACLRVGQLVNQTELGRDVALSQATVHRWLNLLETSYLLLRLPAFAVNRTKRLIKTPKLYWGDTGVAMHLREESTAGGAMLENLVLHDLAAWRDSRLERTELSYWRTASGEEVDFVVETGGHSIPIEVKATNRPRLGDTAHLRSFRAEHPKHARAGLLLHTGKTTEWIAPGVLAVPWWRIL